MILQITVEFLQEQYIWSFNITCSPPTSLILPKPGKLTACILVETGLGAASQEHGQITSSLLPLSDLPSGSLRDPTHKPSYFTCLRAPVQSALLQGENSETEIERKDSKLLEREMKERTLLPNLQPNKRIIKEKLYANK